MNIEQYAASVVIYYALTGLCLLLSKIMIMLSIGFSCKSKGAKNQAGWMALAFFFPVITGFVYLCAKDKIKTNVPKLCLNCHATIPQEYVTCPNCNSAYFQNYAVMGDKKYKKNSVSTLVVAIISAVLAVVFFVMIFVSTINLLGGKDKILEDYGSYGNGNYDSFEDYYNDFYKDFYNQFENEYSDDNNSGAEDFNNFGQ